MSYGMLWLPIIVSTVAVFVLSSILHMVLKHHKYDYKGLSGEDAVREVVRTTGPAPGG